jgi:hypothetical protein
MASNYKYLDADFNQIFANNPLETFSYYKTVSTYKTNSTAKTYNATNGSTTQQNNIKYTYNNSTNFSLGIQAFYIEYFYTGSSVNVTIPNFCKKIRYYLVGGGGSGGAGGGDVSGKSGTNGAGGGGGGYQYGELVITADKNVSVFVGRGGQPVSGGNPSSGDSNNGNVGKAGEDSSILYGGIYYRGFHGTGGDGGHPSSSASPGIGGTGNIKGGANSNGMTGGSSGYSIFQFNTPTDFSAYFRAYSSNTYGNGGNGTSGGGDPNPYLTGAGSDGYARIYFMV